MNLETLHDYYNAHPKVNDTAGDPVTMNLEAGAIW